MPKRLKERYPKSISKEGNCFKVRVYSKNTKKIYYIGLYKSLEEAILARDNWIVENYSLVEGYLPRGIYCTNRVGGKKYVAQFKISNSSGKTIGLSVGTYNTIGEAMEARRNFIMSLI